MDWNPDDTLTWDVHTWITTRLLLLVLVWSTTN